MNLIECKQIGEKAYKEKLENGLEVIIIPKENFNKKYIIFGTKFGSIDNTFINPETNKRTAVPDGVAHFLEHKMFEQKNGEDALYAMMALGIDANAYTTNDHTAYLFECTDHFYEGLDLLMDYVQNPYFTNENVEKEKGIIGQEIRMYEDDPGWQLYMQTMDCLYKNNPIKIDIAGSIESISKINPDILNECYSTFYNPSNMVLVACGNFEPEELLEEIKKRLLKARAQGNIERIYPELETEINKKYSEKKMPISMPIFMLGFKDKVLADKNEMIKKHLALEILMNYIVGESSDLYSELYDNGLVLGNLDFDYEFSSQYAHATISGQSEKPENVAKKIESKIEEIKEKGIDKTEFDRIKKKVYGEYILQFNDVSSVGRLFLANSVKGVESFDYISNFKNIDLEFTKRVLMDVFSENNRVLSVIQK